MLPFFEDRSCRLKACKVAQVHTHITTEIVDKFQSLKTTIHKHISNIICRCIINDAIVLNDAIVHL